MADVRQIVIDELVLASRILAAEGILDSFGHVSARHPERPDRFFISRRRAAELITRDDIVELDLDCRDVASAGVPLFAERVIHAAVLQARPDVMAVCHHHALAVLPFCVSGVPLVPVIHLGATMGETVPFWSPREEFGDTDILVSTPAQGASMARALGPHWTVLLRHHGATVAGRSVRECVFRAIYGARNAETQRRALQMGPLATLTAGEAALAGAFNLTPIAVDRSWDHWVACLPAQPALSAAPT